MEVLGPVNGSGDVVPRSYPDGLPTGGDSTPVTVYYGSDANVARPDTTAPVIWIGSVSVAPVNAINNDMVTRPATLDFVSQTEFDEQGPSGRLLAEAVTSDYQSGIPNAATNINGLNINFTVGSRPVLVELYLPWVANSVADGGMLASIALLDGTATAFATMFSPIATGAQNILVRERITTPGTYDRKGMLQRWGATGTVSNNFNPASAAVVSRLSAVEQ